MPAQLFVMGFDVQQFLTRRINGVIKTRFGYHPIREKLFRIGNAAHMQAFQRLGFKAFANNKFGTATADIHHQTATGIVSQRVRHTEINKACFFAPGNDFNRVTQNLFSAFNKLLTVARRAQCIGGQHTHPAWFHALHKLRKLAQALKSALLRFFRQNAAFIQTGSQLNLLTTTFKSTYFALKLLCDDHMKTVGTQVHRCDQIVHRASVICHNYFPEYW